MSTLRVANVHFDSTQTNFIDNRTTNTIRINTTNLELNATSIITTGTITTATGGAISAVNVQTFNASGTWTKPSGYAAGSRVHVQVWSAGGSGSRKTATASGLVGAGGCGGGYEEGWYTLSSLGATETITVGAGGVARTTGNTAGANGSFSSFGSYLVVLGGEGGPIDSTGRGRGGGISLSGSTTDLGANNRFTIGSISYTSSADTGSTGEGFSGIGNGCGDGTSPTPGYKVGGGGGIQEMPSVTAAHRMRARANGAASVFGGGGGGVITNLANVGIGGASTFGGRGGNASTNFVTAAQAGFAPGGGGGHSPANNASATSGAGGDGRIVITIFPG